jgi:hypothetical protein
VRAAWLVSVQSVAWTVVAGSGAIALGLVEHSAVLVAFGAIGLVDAAGSTALVHHFSHSARHDELSEHLERRAHRIVLVGMFVVGSAAIIGSIARLVTGASSRSSTAGVVLVAASLVVLLALSARKRSLATVVSSGALRSDGHLSAVGAAQACVALVGTAAAAWFAWPWADAAAALVVGCVAAAVAGQTWRTEMQTRRRVSRQPSFVPVALLLALVVAVLDALLGEKLILIGCLALVPACAALSLQLRTTLTVSACAVGVAVLLGVPDNIWLTFEHGLWVSAVALVGLANTAVVRFVGARIRERQSLIQAAP